MGCPGISTGRPLRRQARIPCFEGRCATGAATYFGCGGEDFGGCSVRRVLGLLCCLQACLLVLQKASIHVEACTGRLVANQVAITLRYALASSAGQVSYLHSLRLPMACSRDVCIQKQQLDFPFGNAVCSYLNRHSKQPHKRYPNDWPTLCAQFRQASQYHCLVCGLLGHV